MSEEAPTPPSTSASSPSTDRLWIIVCHLSIFLGVGLILPLIVYLVYKSDPQSPITEHAQEALNFHISLFIFGVIGAILTIIVIGIFVVIAVAVGGMIFAIIGALKASSGELYRYPLTIRLVK